MWTSLIATRISRVCSVVVAATIVLFLSVGPAQAQVGFSNASLQGSYGFSGEAGPNATGALGVVTVEGNDAFTGMMIVNTPAPEGERSVVPGIGLDGTYVIDDSGFGTIFVMQTLPDGTTSDRTLDLVVTRARVNPASGVKIIREFHALQREPASPEGILLKLVFKQLPK